MKTESILAIVVPLVALPIIGIISYFLKGLFKDFKKETVSLGNKIERLDVKFSDFQLTIQKIALTLTAVEKDLDRANVGLNKTSELALKNSEGLKTLEHKFEGIKSNFELVAHENVDLSSKVVRLEKDIIKLQAKK